MKALPGAVVGEVAAEAGVDSVAARPPADFPAAGGPPDARQAAEGEALRVAAVPAPTAGRRSVHRAERARGVGERARGAAPWPGAGLGSNPVRDHPLAAAQEARDPEPVSASDRRLARAAPGLELAPVSFRQEARAPEWAGVSDRGSVPALGLE